DTIVIGQRMRDNGFKNGLVDDFFVFDLALSPAEVSALATTSEITKPDLSASISTGRSIFRLKTFG
ncbi:MAG: hypothetical protein AAF039_06440, partial [Bacteroidota bacterium]